MYNKKLLVVLCAIFCQGVLMAQPVTIWNKIFGAPQAEYSNNLGIFEDSLLICVGKSNSTALVNKGLNDAAIAVIRQEGSLKQIKTFGSPADDFFTSFVSLPNGTQICGATVSGKGGDVTNVYGFTDVWLVNYNAKTNTKNWEKNFGGTNNDQVNDIFYLETGKVIFAGATKSLDKDVPANKGGFDVLVGTVDEAGGINKIRNLGGSKDEFARRIIRADGANFFVGGESLSSNEGDFIGLTNKGMRDIFLFKFSRNTNQVFTAMYGGPGDDLFGDMVALPDGSAILFLNVNTKGGDIDTIKGGKDILMLNIKPDGKILSKRIIGGTKDDVAVKARLNSKNEIILLSTSGSSDGDYTANYGANDVVIMKLDLSGNIIWQQNYGGKGAETASSLCLDATGNIFFMATSFSITNDLPTTNVNAPDFWTMKLYDCSPLIADYTANACLGDTVTINNKKYYSGFQNGSDTMIAGSYRGCDSIVNVFVNFNLANTFEFRDTLCNEGTITIQNEIFDKNKPTGVFVLKNANIDGCDSTINVNIHFGDKIDIQDTVLILDNGNGVGSIKLVPKGGFPPYTYLWSNGKVSNQIINLKSAVYRVTVTDSRACGQQFEFKLGSTVGNSDINETEILISSDHKHIYIESKEIIDQIEVMNADGITFTNIRPNQSKCVLDRDQYPSQVLLLRITAHSGKTSVHKLMNY